MRLLILADLHANWAALSAIKEDFDHLIVLGDMVDWGVQPVECVDYLRDHADWSVVGNHDLTIASGGGSPFAELSRSTLGPERLNYLSSLPQTCEFELGGASFFAVHATACNPLSKYVTPDTPQSELEAEFESVSADFILAGHSHLPMVKQVGRSILVNPGSVGQPRDRDTRAGYAIWEDGRVILKRQEYDLESAVGAVRSSALEPGIADTLAKMLITGLQFPDRE